VIITLSVKNVYKLEIGRASVRGETPVFSALWCCDSNANANMY